MGSRHRLASVRAQEAHEALAGCDLCGHRCGADRLAGERGPCGVGARSRVFSAQIELSDELELAPCFAIAFSGCDLRCSFCITGAESWNARAGQPFEATLLASQALNALTQGARSIMILGGEPTVHLPAALELVALLPDDVRLVWKTNGQGTERSRLLLDGLFDVWLVDYKFGTDSCAGRLGGGGDYVHRVRENLQWARSHSELIVRHLLMPGHLDCCWVPVASWLAENLPGIKMNLRSGFWPGWKASRHAELRGTVLPREMERAQAIAQRLNLNLVD